MTQQVYLKMWQFIYIFNENLRTYWDHLQKKKSGYSLSFLLFLAFVVRIISWTQVMCVVVVWLTSAPSYCTIQYHCLLTCKCSAVGLLQRSGDVGLAVVTGPGLIVCSLYAEVIGRCHCLNHPSFSKNEQGPANCNGLFIISNQTLSYKPGEAASSQTISEALWVTHQAQSWTGGSLPPPLPRMLWNLPHYPWGYLVHSHIDLLSLLTWMP